ncbi:hypothetical protein EFM1CSP_12355 [Enterococcus faecium]|nr:hypothetical protein EFM1CSP_12355 [Enterococcus faecium]
MQIFITVSFLKKKLHRIVQIYYFLGAVTKVVSQSLFPNKRCSISCPSVLAQKTAKYEKLFFRFVSLILRSNR